MAHPTKSTPSGDPPAGFLTPRQVLVLIALALLGLLVLGGVALRLLAAAPEQVAIVPTLPPDVAEVETPAADTTPVASQLLPPGCEPVRGSLINAPTAVVLDSQTIEVMLDQVPTRLQFAGIALPVDPPAAAQAAAEIRALIDGQPVVFVPIDEVSASGDRLAYVYANGWFLNHELLLRGMAQVDPSGLGQACAGLFQAAQQQAAASRAGMWQPTRVPTATFLPTVGLDPSFSAPCDCMSRPLCSDFTSHDEAQACYNACNDYNSRLDDDRDGLACEGLP